MPTFISKTKLEKESKKNNKVINLTHNAGEIYPQIFSHFTQEDLKTFNIAIIWLGAYEIDSNLFEKQTCPKCGKSHSLKPYACGGSILSGAHTIQFYCENCKEQFVTNDYIEYFRIIYHYVNEHKKELCKSNRFINCSKTRDKAKIIY